MRLCPKCGVKTEEARCPDDGTATLVLAQNPESRLSKGTEINGRYRVDEMIGQGGFGSVYRATSLATDQEMAIKVLGVSLDDDDSDLIQRFFAEAQITAGLKHPNTIRVFDFGQTEGGALYIAMELLTGRDLNDILKERRATKTAMTEKETVNLTSQVLRSLAEAHMAGLVHRDLKPHNIFLNEVPGDDPVVKVLDFGIAKRLGSNLTGTGQAFGTPSYMSPEQAQNKPVDARSDLYSLGAVMYQCVSGSCPFEGDNPLAVLLAHVTDTPADLRTRALTPLSEDFVRIVERALAKGPDERFDGAIAMRQALSEIGNGGADGIGAPTHLGVGTMQPASESSGDTVSQPVEIDDAGEDDRTAAYVVPKTPSAPSAVDGPVDDGQGAHQPAQGASRTEAFFVKNDATEDAAATPSAASSDAIYGARNEGHRKKGLGLAIALGLGTLVIAGGAAAVLLGGDKPAPPPPETIAAQPEATANAEPAPTSATAADASAAEADAAGADAADAVADTAPVAAEPEVVEVEVRTEPSGATLEIDGKAVGKAPMRVSVSEDKPIRVRLALKGYRETEVMLAHTDRQGRTVKLSRVTPARTVRRNTPPKRGVSSSGTRKEPPPTPTRRTKSALEERL